MMSGSDVLRTMLFAAGKRVMRAVGDCAGGDTGRGSETMLGGDGTAAAVDATLATMMEGRRSSNRWLLDEMVSAITHTCSATTPSWRPRQTIFRPMRRFRRSLDLGKWVVGGSARPRDEEPSASHARVCV